MTRLLRFPLAALAVLMLFVAGGCFAGPAKSAPKTAENFLHALAKKDVEKTCLMIADEDEGPMKKGSQAWQSCLGAMNTLLAKSDTAELATYAKANVKSAEIDGNTAKVDEDAITGVLEPDISLELIQFDKLWYVSDFD